MKTNKIVLLNGGKGSGKTVAVDSLQTKFLLVRAECKQPLFDLTIKLFNTTPTKFFEAYLSRIGKEIPQDFLQIDYRGANQLYQLTKDRRIAERIELAVTVNEKVYLSPREALIFISECVVKPTFGKDYFGQARVNFIEQHSSEYNEMNVNFIDDSAGFVEELPPLITRMGQENIILIRVRGRGDFEGDSRSFIPDGIIKNTVDIYNTKSEAEYLEQILKLTEDFLNAGK